jgi:DNA/RNA-binding domain of Phe-tRNA-synthetase-like protein
MTIRLAIDPAVQELAVGVVEAKGMKIADSTDQLREYCVGQVEQVAQAGTAGGDERRDAVRRLLRHGGFKPAGRNKPAQEYLLRAAGDPSAFPVILNAVDVLNVVSLKSGLPISLVALSRVNSPLQIRYGRMGERFVFNRSGQELNLAGLICLCGRDAVDVLPAGTPVKDSMHAKVTEDDHHVLACIYAPRSAVSSEELQGWTTELADGFTRWCGADDVNTMLEPAQWST